MFAIDLISSAIPALTPNDSAGKALELMNEFHADKLPVVARKNYLGLAEEDQLLKEDAKTLLSDIALSVIKPAIREDVHFLEALKIVGDYQLSLLPVLDKAMHYAGAIPVNALLKALSRFNDVQQEGGTLIVEMKPSDYMLSEIARVAESIDVSLLGIHTMTAPESGVLRVLLKTNRQNLDDFAGSLKQLNYNIIYHFDKADNSEGLQKNYENLMNYINM